MKRMASFLAIIAIVAASAGEAFARGRCGGKRHWQRGGQGVSQSGGGGCAGGACGVR